MCFYFIAFFLGVLILQTFTVLPNLIYLAGILALLIILAISLSVLRKALILAIFFLVGMLWTDWYAQDLLSWRLPAAKVNYPIIIKGYVASLPVKTAFGMRFEFDLTDNQEINAAAKTIKIRLTLPATLLVRSPELSHLSVGQHWQLAVRLKRIHGLQNPGTFDYEAWALSHGIRAEGRIIMSKENSLLDNQWLHYPWQRIRQRIKNKIIAYSPASQSAPWLLALTIGEHENITANDWSVLRKTGTNHLMAIAGLHIGLIAGFSKLFTKFILRRASKLFLYCPLPVISTVAAMLTAITYAALSGFSLPAQRACLMLIISMSAFFLRRQLNPWHIWSLALCAVLCINPLDILSESFWLSFFTIALIIFGMHGRNNQTLWWKWGRVQWVIGIGLIPLSLTFFQECSLISFMANAVTIPWLGFLILPLCFVAACLSFVSPALTKILLWAADWQLTQLFSLLAWFSHWPWAAWSLALPNPIYSLMIMLGILLILLPHGVPQRFFGFFIICPLFFLQYMRPNQNEAWLHILDVGQGLAVVFQTRHHVLLYDTGQRFSHSDSGESVIIPFLNTQGIKKIDKLVVSHGDSDHTGGLQSVSNKLPIKDILTSVPALKINRGFMHCDKSKNWQWDGVSFQFLSPDRFDRYAGNDSSCVLLIRNGKHTILLPGDIEKTTEQRLLNAAQQLAADILLVPHHGSRTSAEPRFIQAVHPRYAVYAAGYQNRYHLPHPKVKLVYQVQQAKELITAETGMITFKLPAGNGFFLPILYRKAHPRYWYDNLE